MKSTFLTVNVKDLIKGLILTVIVAILGSAIQFFEAGTVEWTWAFWQPIVYSSVGAGMAYLLKNLLTNSEDQFAKTEPK